MFSLYLTNVLRDHVQISCELGFVICPTWFITFYGMEPCVAMVLFSMVGKSPLYYFLPTRAAMVNNRI